MTEILIAGGVVVTMDPERRVIEDGAVAIKDDRIVAVGETAALSAAHPYAQRIDAKRKIVMPGLIDGHAHAGHGLVKTMGGGDGNAWYKACEQIYTTGSDGDFWYAESRLAALERLKAGVTTGVSLLGGGDSFMRTDDTHYGERHCDGVAEIGTRSIVAVGPTRKLAPLTYRTYHANGSTSDRDVTFKDQVAVCEALIDGRHGSADGRVQICLITPVYRPADEELTAAEISVLTDRQKEIRALSRARGVLFTQDGHLTGSIATAHELFGHLGPDALFSHSIDLTEAEIALCRETGTRIVHNPSAVMSIRGRCPVPELLDAGVTVLLGSDGTAPDRGGDMFRHMWQCMHYHRRHFRDAGVLPPGKVLEMCTIDAAHGLGMADQIGSLEAGKKADVILVDLAKPHLYPYNMPLYRLVCFASGADVDTVIVNGKILMQGRNLTETDEMAVLEDAQIATEKMLDRTGLRPLLDLPSTFWGHTHY